MKKKESSLERLGNSIVNAVAMVFTLLMMCTIGMTILLAFSGMFECVFKIKLL